MRLIDTYKAMSPAERKIIGESVGLLVGAPLSYLIYRRLGAPRWAALGFTDIAMRFGAQSLTAKIDALKNGDE